MKTHTDIDQHKADRERVARVLSRPEMILPNTPENVSRDRLMRIRAGVQHLLNEVVPALENPSEQQEVYLWVEGIWSILRIEQCCAIQEAIKRGKGL
ncbi:hypothetical protein [Pantoea coffeiphila]|uniref:hypothetical protein n=1 Tax=Pantoea coffeiphila TaxID=1465635 RepID=UPI00195FBB82|nr:hypothetical protein [Pantoea coffeiphila]MBM7342726.1 hypothetical protein [Pantoea coffeiphila]